MRRPDYDQIDRDAFAEMRRERDRSREPSFGSGNVNRRLPPGHRDGAALLPQVQPARSPFVRLPCPLCRGPVYAPRGSTGEHIDCVHCSAALVTRGRTTDAVEVVPRDPDEEGRP